MRREGKFVVQEGVKSVDIPGFKGSLVCGKYGHSSSWRDSRLTELETVSSRHVSQNSRYCRIDNIDVPLLQGMSGQNIIIRRADITDIEGVASLFDSYREFYGKSSDLKQSIQFLSERISAKESFILVAEIKGKSVGFTQLYPFFSSVQTTRLMVLNDLFVVPEVRRKGVAKKLMDAAVKLANEEGCGGLILETTEDNVQAQSLYKKLGWKEETGVRHYSFDIERL